MYDVNEKVNRGQMDRSSGEPRVFVSRSLAGLGAPDPLAALRQIASCDVWSGDEPPTPEELAARAHACAGLLCLLTDCVDADFLDACPQLRVVSSMSVGVDHIDLQAARARDVEVGYTPGVLVETTAELTFGLLLAAARRIPEAERFVRAGEWTPARRWEPDMLLGRDLHGATLGVIGLGSIGQAVARRAAGFGMKVCGFTRSGRQVPGVVTLALSEVLERSDFLVVTVALAPETRGMIGVEEIRRMQPGAILVNTARGGIVDEGALARALETGHLAAAALDVFAEEPLSATSPLLAAPNLVLSPHIGSASIATRRRMALLAVENLIAGLEGAPLVHSALADQEV